MKNHQKRSFGSLSDNPVLAGLAGDPSQASQDSPGAGNARWFFVQQGSERLALEPAVATVFQDVTLRANSVPNFAKFWPHLIARHRASQLVTTIEGQDFLRYCAFAPLDVLVSSEWLAWLLLDPKMSSLLNVPDVTHGMVVSAYLKKVTSPIGCNAHVSFRDLGIAILSRTGNVITDVLVADQEFPVDEETVTSIVSWARSSYTSGSDLFSHPYALDTQAGMIADLFAATKQESLAKSKHLMGLPDRLSQQRGKTLARRAALAQYVFFSQATKVGLDYVRR